MVFLEVPEQRNGSALMETLTLVLFLPPQGPSHSGKLRVGSSFTHCHELADSVATRGRS